MEARSSVVGLSYWLRSRCGFLLKLTFHSGECIQYISTISGQEALLGMKMSVDGTHNFQEQKSGMYMFSLCRAWYSLASSD